IGMPELTYSTSTSAWIVAAAAGPRLAVTTSPAKSAVHVNKARIPLPVRLSIRGTVVRRRTGSAVRTGENGPMPSTDILDLETHGVDTHVGSGPRYPWGGLYGGQIIAQALRAATLSLGDEAKEAHSLRAYFIRSGDQ